MAQTRYRRGPLHSTGLTYTGDVQHVTVAADTGVKTVIATPWMTAVVPGVTVNSTFGDSPTIQTWVQPANSLITQIDVWCIIAPVISSGDIGYEVGTSSGAGQIVAQGGDELVDAGTTVVVNSVAQAALVQVVQSATTFVISAQYTAAARDIFCNIVNSANASTAGSFTFLISYINLDTTAV